MFCLFFGLICAQKDENGINHGKPSRIWTNSELAEAVKELISQVHELENELDHLTKNVNSRIEVSISVL